MPPPPDGPAGGDPSAPGGDGSVAETSAIKGDASSRRRQVAMAGHMQDQTGAALLTARGGLRDPAPAVRATALGALARLNDLKLGDVEEAAADASPVVRARAAELAHRFGPPAVGLLVGLLGDPRPDVVEAACFGLGEMGSDAGDRAVTALSDVAGSHTDPLCREAAIAAIGAIGPGASAAGIAAVLAGMQDKPAVRRRAVLALAAFDGPEVDAALQAALADRDWQVRQAAEDLTGRGGSDE